MNTDRSPAGAPQPADAVRPRPPRRHRLRLDPARRPGHRALGRRVVRPNPLYFDPKNIVELAIEGGCNAVASTFGVLGVGEPALRPPHPVHRQAQPQRAAHLPQQVRPDHVRLGRAGVRPGRRRRRRHHLLRLRGVDPPAPGGQRGLRRGPPARACSPCCGATSATTPSRRTASTTTARRRPHRPGQPPGRHHRGRHHQAEAAREQRRLQRVQGLRQDRQARLRRAHHRSPDRPDPLAGGQLLHGPDRAHQLRRRVQGARATWPRPCAPP